MAPQGRSKPAQALALVRRVDGVVADFDTTLRMPVDAFSQMPGEHLRAEAKAQKRLVFGESYANPVDFPAQVLVAVVGTHRPAEDNGAGMVAHCRWQRVTKAWTADVEFVTGLAQQMADATGRRHFLMKDHQDASGRFMKSDTIRHGRQNAVVLTCMQGVGLRRIGAACAILRPCAAPATAGPAAAAAHGA